MRAKTEIVLWIAALALLVHRSALGYIMVQNGQGFLHAEATAQSGSQNSSQDFPPDVPITLPAISIAADAIASTTAAHANADFELKPGGMSISAFCQLSLGTLGSGSAASSGSCVFLEDRNETVSRTVIVNNVFTGGIGSFQLLDAYNQVFDSYTFDRQIPSSTPLPINLTPGLYTFQWTMAAPASSARGLQYDLIGQVPEPGTLWLPAGSVMIALIGRRSRTGMITPARLPRVPLCAK